MGPLTFPLGGRVCVDTPVVLYTVNRHPKYLPRLAPLWEAARRREVEVVACGLIEMEAYIRPLVRGDDEERKRIDELLSRAVRLLPVSRSVIYRATEMRAAYSSVKAADALHLAASDWSSCEMFLTNDRRLKAVREVPVTILNEVAAP